MDVLPIHRTNTISIFLLHTCNQKYSEINTFKISSSKGLSFQYSLKEADTIPILVGKGLADKYPIDSKSSLVDPALNKKVLYKVKGILVRDPSHSNLYALDSKQYYNFSIIVPVSNAFIEQADISFKINGLMDLTLTDTTRSETKNFRNYIEDPLSLKFNLFTQQVNIDFYNQYFKSSTVFYLR